MNPGLDRAVRSRWLAGLVHAALWVLVYLTITGLHDTTSPYRVADGSAQPPPSPIPVDKVDAVFSVPWPSLAAGSNQPNPFLTSHFTPAPAPAPPPPTTRKIQLAYLGYFAVDGSKQQAVMKMGDSILVTEVGAIITANLYAASATATNVLLTNSVGATNLLTLNQPKELEVPIK